MRLTVCLLAITAFTPLAAQQASLVYRLGRDTVAVEQFSRAPGRVSGEMVQRSGAAVAMVRYEVTLGPTGRPATATIRRVQQDGSPFPGQPVETRFVFHTDSVTREAAWADSAQRRSFAARGALLALPVFVYGPMEILAVLRRSGVPSDSIPALGAAGGVGFIGLEAAGGDTLRLRGSPYPMRLVFDGAGRLLAVDGAGTTNKILAVRGQGGLDIAMIARSMKPTGILSARDVARGSFGAGGIVLIDHGRPMVRERTVWGGALVPFDSVWRAGANDATHLFTTRQLAFEGLTVPPGSYTLWVRHTRSATFLIVNRQTGQWGTQYDPAQDLGRVQMQPGAVRDHVEELTWTVRSVAGNRGVIELAWGSQVYSAAFSATAPPIR